MFIVHVMIFASHVSKSCITHVTLVGPVTKIRKNVRVMQTVGTLRDTNKGLYLLIVGVPPLVIVLVPNSRESPWTVLALVRLLPRVDAHVNEQISALIEIFLTPHALEEAVAVAEGQHRVLLEQRLGVRPRRAP